jgi:sulfatase modifying factor 1
MLMRGHGHARVGTTKQGINGLYDMGANVWEWALISPEDQQQATMGGSWWYGSEQMKADYGATKPREMAVVYIGFRCYDG